MQLEAIASRPIAGYLGEETNTCLTTATFQVVVESDKVPPQPPLLQTIRQDKQLRLNTQPLAEGLPAQHDKHRHHQVTDDFGRASYGTGASNPIHFHVSSDAVRQPPSTTAGGDVKAFPAPAAVSQCLQQLGSWLWSRDAHVQSLLHQITERFGLEVMFKGHLVQPPLP